MKKFYNQTKSKFTVQNRGQAFIFILGLLICTNMAFAQTEMTWTGAVSENFLVEDNWNPAGSPSGNTLTLPLIQYDSLGNLLSDNDVCPVLSGSEDVTVYSIEMTKPEADTVKARPLTVNLDESASLTISGGKSINYLTPNVIVNSGTLYFNNYERFEKDYFKWIINGGTIYCSKSGRTMQFGNKAQTLGGQVYINGGMLYVRAGGVSRPVYSRDGGQFIITGEGVLKAEGEYDWQQYIESGWINGGDDYYPVLEYDAVNDLTIVTAVPTDTVMFRSSESQELSAGEAEDTLYLVLTNRVSNAQSISWKYRKEGETTYTTIEGADTTCYAPSFSEGGTYYLLAEVVDADGVIVRTGEVEYTVISDMITLSPDFDVQYIRVGEKGTTITATFKDDVTPASMEWKYSSEIGGTYVSFDPAQTEASINPVFNLDSAETGKSYYMLLEATINGTVYQSPNLQYVVEHQSTTGKSITWTGLISTDVKDPGNWDPVASYFKNTLTINELDSTNANYPNYNYPVLTLTGNDTIKTLYLYGGTFDLVQGSEGVIDTFNVRGDAYIQSTLNVDNVMIDYTSYYWRIPTYSGKMTLNGEASLNVLYNESYDASLLMGEKGETKGDGGTLTLNDNSRARILAFARMQSGNTSDSCVISVNDSAMLFYRGDGCSEIETYIDSTKIRCDDEGYEPYVLYPYEYDDSVWTVVKARNTNAFSIEDDSRTFTTAGYETDDPITLINTDGVTSWEWKYSTSVNGPFNSFDPAVTDEGNFYPSFDEADDYYIIAETSDGVETSNMKEVTVIDMSVTPADTQYVALGGTFDSLFVTYTIPEDLTLGDATWIYTAYGEDISTGISDSVYLPEFEEEGTYEVFYYAQVKDENSVSYYLQSNVVTIVYGSNVVDELSLGTLKLYPNPTSGKFNIEGTFDEDYNLEIFDLSGNMVYKQMYSAQSSPTIELSNKGVYIVKMSSDKNMKVGRLIVK